ncbi:uncharacterized protein LOC144631519 [Oculina patagonica]
MSSSTLIEVFGHIVFSFTRGVTEHYNPEEPEFTAESFGYDPLQGTGREWYNRPVNELIYQEYSDTEVTSFHYSSSSRLDIRVIDACSPEENEETQDDRQDEDKSMAWKHLRPSAFQTVSKSLYIGAFISLFTATIIGAAYVLISYVYYKTGLNCDFHPKRLIPVRVQWAETISDAIPRLFYHTWIFFILLFLFRPYQLEGLKRKLVLVSCTTYCLNFLYCVALQAVGTPYYTLPTIYQIPHYICFLSSIFGGIYIVARHFFPQSRKKVAILVCKMALPMCFSILIAFVVAVYVYPSYNKQDKEGKLLIALFAPLIGVVLKAISRICAQRLWNITHPGYSYVLLAPLYFGSAVMFRVLQADLGNLQSIAALGIVHGAAEVIERSIMVVIDHVCHVIWKRKSASWGSFRTPRRERLMADIAIMSMLFESTAIVSVNGFLYSYQFIYLQNGSILKLLQSFAIHTLVQLVIEWFFTSVSLAIETRYQNMPVMAIWRRRWKRHTLVAVVNVLPIAIWTSANLLQIIHGHFEESAPNKPCKMPFS